MGEEIPLKWLQFELAISQLVERDTTLCSLDQVIEVDLHSNHTMLYLSSLVIGLFNDHLDNRRYSGKTVGVFCLLYIFFHLQLDLQL